MSDTDLITTIRKVASFWRRRLEPSSAPANTQDVIARSVALDMLNALDPAMIEGQQNEREALLAVIRRDGNSANFWWSPEDMADAILKAGWHR